MTLESNPAWKGNFVSRVVELLNRRGFESLSDFLSAFPSDTYPQLAERLGPDIAPVQIQQLQFLEAMDANTVRVAAIDGLARKLREHLPEGWAGDPSSRSMAMSAFAHWAGMVETRAKSVKGDALLAVWRALERACPPGGWLPSSARDECLGKAFAEAW